LRVKKSVQQNQFDKIRQKMRREVLIGMTTGAAFMWGFGALWLLMGLFRGRPSPPWLRICLLAAGIVLASSVAFLARRASQTPSSHVALTQQQMAANRDIGKRFYIVFGLELAAILVAVIVLRALHFPDYISSAVALIVGVHFFPLAALFESPVYYGTGLLGCGIGLLGFFIADAAVRQKAVGLSFGLVLWATAAWIVFFALAGGNRLVSRG
jgi:hypothetical protein